MSLAVAQDVTPSSPSNTAGDLPYSASIGTSIEHVQLASGSVEVRLPFIGIPGRGMSFNYGIRYDSDFWSQYPDGTSFASRWQPAQKNWLQPTVVGWTSTEPYVTWQETPVYCTSETGHTGDGTNDIYTPGGTWLHNYIYTDESGAQHPLIGERAQTTALLGVGSSRINSALPLMGRAL
jgi:hypothetical protein